MEPPSRPEDLIGRPMPDLVLVDPEGRPYPVRRHVGHSPFVLFFLIRSDTPG
jgi:hypothetical protein